MPVRGVIPIGVLGALLALPASMSAQQRVYNGRNKETTATIPHLDDDSVVIDGVLREAAWGKAALLTGFSSYLPIDDRPADDSTEIYVW